MTGHTENHERRRLTSREMTSLADRLLSRALSLLFEDYASIKGDMVLASACLRVLASDRPDGIEVDVWRL